MARPPPIWTPRQCRKKSPRHDCRISAASSAADRAGVAGAWDGGGAGAGAAGGAGRAAVGGTAAFALGAGGGPGRTTPRGGGGAGSPAAGGGAEVTAGGGGAPGAAAAAGGAAGGAAGAACPGGGGVAAFTAAAQGGDSVPTFRRRQASASAPPGVTPEHLARKSEGQTERRAAIWAWLGCCAPALPASGPAASPTRMAGANVKLRTGYRPNRIPLPPCSPPSGRRRHRHTATPAGESPRKLSSKLSPGKSPSSSL